MRARVVDPFAPVRRRQPRQVPPPSPVDADHALPAPTTFANGLFGVQAAAERLGMTRREVGDGCRNGTLPCTKADNGRWLVDVPAAQAARKG